MKMRSISVVGIGETKMGKFPNRSYREMILEAGNAAILDSGIDKKDIQAVYMGNFDGAFLSNQNHFGPMVSEVLGLGNVPTVRTEGACASGGLAFRMGLLGI
ncbi:MAG: thiolase domain-containing protein, partial [Candidatus Taylorbacteria bacterium]